MHSHRHGLIFLLVFLGAVMLGYGVLRLDSPLVVSAAAEGNPGLSLNRQPYEIGTSTDHSVPLTLTFRYVAGQNANFVIETFGGCIVHAWAGPTGGPLAALDIATFCREGVLNLGPHLQDGLNQITLSINADPSANWDKPAFVRIEATSELFGGDVFSTLACLGITAAASLLLYRLMLGIGIDKGACGLAAAGFVFYCFWLHLRPNTVYTADMPDHLGFILHMVRHWASPYDYTGGENHQPAPYYFLAGRFICLLRWMDALSVLTLARLFSLLLYTIFLVYGVRTLHEASRMHGAAYYVGIAALVFWPVAVDTATNLDNDLAVYAAWGPAFYYLTRWFRGRDVSCLYRTLVLAGVVLMMKSTALLLFAIIGCTMLYALAARRLKWRELITPRIFAVYGAIALCVVVNLGQVLYSRFVQGQSVNIYYVPYFYLPEVVDHSHFTFSYFLHFGISDFIAHPYSTFLNEPDFLNYFLKTALYSQWNHPGDFGGLASIVNALTVLFLFTILLSCVIVFIRRKPEARDLVPMVLGTLLPLPVLILFTVMHNDEFWQSMRLVYPMLVPLMALFIRGMEVSREIRLTRPLYLLGLMAGAGLPFSALILYLSFHPAAYPLG